MIDVSMRWGGDRGGATAEQSGTGDLAVADGHDHRAAPDSGWAVAAGGGPLAPRLPGDPGLARGRRPADAVVGTGGGHRLGAQQAVPPPRADGAPWAHSPGRLRHR